MMESSGQAEGARSEDAEREPRVQIYPDESGEWRWRLIGANGEIVLPPEGHRDSTDALRSFTTAVEVIAALPPSGYIEILEPGPVKSAGQRGDEAEADRMAARQGYNPNR